MENAKITLMGGTARIQVGKATLEGPVVKCGGTHFLRVGKQDYRVDKIGGGDDVFMANLSHVDLAEHFGFPGQRED